MPQSTARRRITSVTMRTYHSWIRRAQDSGLLPATGVYTRFVCVGNPRTGSTLLMRSLNNHSRMIGYGEIVKNFDRYPGHYHEFGNGEALFRRDPVAFLQSRVFRKYPPAIQAVGFKIFYHHAPRDTNWGRAVWDYLLSQPDMKVLHLKRRNLLKTFLSKKQAGLTGEYIQYTANGANEAITLDSEEALAFFEQMRQGETDYDNLLRGRPLIEVIYEDMNRDYTAEMRRIQGFLGVDLEDIDPGTVQRPKRSLSSQIANYDELAARFRETPWEGFFTV